MPLTDTAIRRVIPGPKTQKLTDGQGMYLEVAPSGGKWWRLKYRIAGVEKRLSLGTYPDTSLKAARDKRDEARALIAQGIDPSDVRKASKVQTQADEADAAREAAGLPPPDSFEQIAREWYETRKEDWSASYGQKIMRRLEVDVFPWLGAKPITSITPPMVLAVLRRVEGRGVVETAHRALENCGQVFRYAVATGRIVSDPARDLKDALRRPMVKHFPAITSPERLGTLLRAIDSSTVAPPW